MRKSSVRNRVLSLLLAVAMVLSAVPVGAIPARAVTPDTHVADTATHESWEQFFNMKELSSQNAGMVWTDKSVFTEVPAEFQNLHDLDSSGTTSITMDPVDQDSFLVALSVMASNKTITGYSTIPTDTVFVLDLSSSMRSNDNKGGSAIDELVKETNAAITRLMALNNHNRVGVVLYAGNTAGDWTSKDGGTVTILPLDRYTAGDKGNFLVSTNRVSGKNTYADQRVEVAKNVKNSAGNTVTGAKDTATGTFIQDGIYEAMKEFAKADPVIADDKIQAGTVRMPILVLMSDGEPTMANHSIVGDTASGEIGNTGVYNNLGNSILAISNRDGYSEQDARNSIAFMTQLEAMYINAKVEEHYGRDMLFYTLTYGDEAVKRSEAMSVMNPAQTNKVLNDLWDKLQKNGSVEVYKHGKNTYKAVLNDYVDQNSAKFEGRVYVDKFYPANNDSDFSQAFASIVDEIVLQSQYSPTLVESGLHDLDGYVSFVDHIGEHMEVTDIKGMIIGDHYFSGAAFSHNLVNGGFGTLSSPTDLGDEFVRSVMERLGIEDTYTAQALIDQAYRHGQLSYTSHTEFSNYIGWYSDVNGDFVGFWYEGIDTAVPTGATHINRSYGYLGEVDEEHGVRQSDMMYATVRIRQEISTGDVTLAWAIPSALIPTISYEVRLNGETYSSEMESITASGATNGPIRLIFEVALQEDIHDYNIHEKVGAGIEGHESHYQDGKYVFYSNDWKADQTNSDNTYAYFEASRENEYYYYVSDAVIYTDAAGLNPYTGEAQPDSEGEYWHEYYVYSAANGTQRKTERISENALKAAQRNGDHWVVPKGTEYQLLSTRHRVKGENTTGTMGYESWAIVNKGANAEYHTAAVLGNNGKLTVAPATGIKVTKTLAETVENGETAFTFTISGGSGTATLIRPGANADGTDQTETLTFADGKASFTVSADETVYITGLQEGISYTVTESRNPDYAVQTVTVGGKAVESAVITLEKGQMESVGFVNAPKGYGNLYITKEITHDQKHAVPDSMLSQAFTLTVTMAGLANQRFAAIHSGDPALKEIVTDGEGKFDVTLKNGETFEVLDIPENTVITVTEALDEGSNFTVTYRSRDYSGAEADDNNQVTVRKNHNSTVVVMNNYVPKSTSVDLDIEGSKIFANGTGSEQIFNFKVQKWNGTKWEDMPGMTGSVTYSAEETAETTKEFFIENVLNGIVYTEAGEYAYQVVEVIPEDRADGIVYDRATHTVTVKVEDINGQLTASVITHNAAITPSENTFVVEPKFHNYYHYDIVSIDLTKILDNASGSDRVNRSGYEFVLKEGDTVVAREFSDAAGEARMVLAYDSIDAGTHTYTLQEIAPAADPINGMHYTATVYTVTVEVTVDPENHTVSAVITGLAAAEKLDKEAVPTVNEAGDRATVQFVNEYRLTDAELILEAEKVLTGRDPAEGEFEFAIFADGETTNPVATGKNGADGKIRFSKLTFSKVGTYHYDVVEVKGTLGGVTYDSIVYDLVVEVTDNGDGALVAAYYYEDYVGTQITFNNSYEAEPVSLTLGGHKTITNRTLLAGEFVFELKDEAGNVLQSVHNAGANAGGAYTFEPIVYAQAGTYRYTISEVQGNLTGVAYAENVYQVEVEVVDDGNGKFHAYIDGEDVTEKKDYHFANTYTPAEISHTITGTKNLTGMALKEGAFTFVLTNQDGIVIESVNNNANGGFAFRALTFNKIGTYEYMVYELAGSEAGMTYDAAVYEIQIVVTYDSDKGVFHKAVTVSGGDIVFNNAYVAPANVIIAGEKNLTDYENNPVSFEEGDFTFVLSDKAEDGEILETVTNDANGGFAFSALTFWSAGEYDYYVTEQKGTDPSVIYDENVYRIHISVVPNEEGTALVATQTVTVLNQEGQATLTFTNKLRKEAEATLRAEKNLDGRQLAAGEFTFVLRDESGEVIESVTNAANGAVVFETLTYGAEGVYKYTVTEQAGEDSHITYDSKTVYVTVTVTIEGDAYVAEAVYTDANGEAIHPEFNNTYTPDPITETLSGTKTLTGRDLAAGEFSFQLVDAEGNVLQTVTNDADGSFAFAEIEFAAAGTYTYQVREVKGELDNVDYDSTVYTVTVVVAQNTATGVLSLETTIDNGGVLVFGNTYTPDSITETLSGTKTLTGRDLAAGEFSFQLVDAEGNVLQTVTNGADGSFAFAEIEFAAAGTYTYQVREVKGDLDNVDYDSTVYTVTVVVTQNSTTGVLSLETTVDNGGALDFSNTYTPDPISVKVEGTKTLTGRDMRDGEFEFILSQVGKPLSAITRNDADGSFSFSLTFAEVGEYKYSLYEKAGSAPGVTYDDTVYYFIVQVTADAKTGELKAEILFTDSGYTAEKHVPEIVFANTYDPNAANLVVEAKKVLTGREILSGEFEFVLTREGSPLSAVTTNDANGGIKFNLVFNEAGEYHYTLREKAGSQERMEYDTAAYYFTVLVTDPGNGQLETQIIFTDASRTAEIHVENMIFRNVYTPAPIFLDLEGSKTLVGKDLVKGEYAFQLKDEAGNVLQTVTNGADGSFTFENVEFSKVGIYTYTVAEVKGNDSAVTYDETVYTVTVTVTNNNGVLNAEVTVDNGGELTFTNTYTKPDPKNICVPVMIRKVLVNKSDRPMTEAGFRFVIVDGNGHRRYATTGISGIAGFIQSFSAADIGKTFTYTVYELNTGIEDMEYSDAVYTVRITIGLNEQTNELYAFVRVNAVPTNPVVLKFVNVYEPEIPEEPSEPTEPSEPSEPTEPSEPSEPTEPSEPSEPTEPSEPSEPTEPSEPSEPTEPSEPSEPTEPSEPSEPTEPSEPSEPTEPSEPSEPTEPSEPSEPTEPSEPSEPTEPSEPSEPTEPSEPSEPTEPSEPSEPTQPSESSEPTEPSESSKPTESVPTDPEPDEDDVPKTGDNRHIMLWALLAGFSGISALVLVMNPFKRKGRYCA